MGGRGGGVRRLRVDARVTALVRGADRGGGGGGVGAARRLAHRQVSLSTAAGAALLQEEKWPVSPLHLQLGPGAARCAARLWQRRVRGVMKSLA